MCALYLAGIGDQLLDHVNIHHRLTAEEVHLKVAARAGGFDQEIQCATADLKGHQRALALILALACKAVGAVEIAGVCHVQAERLDDLGIVLVINGKIFIHVSREQLARLLQSAHVRDALQDLLTRDVRLVRVLFQDRFDDLLLGVVGIQRNDVVGDLVHSVDRAGAGVQHDVIAV